MLSRRGRIYLTFTIFGLCLFLAARYGLFDRSARLIGNFSLSDLQTLPVINKFTNKSTFAKQNLVNSSVTEKLLKVKPVRANETQPKVEVEKPKPVPVVTAEGAEAQDSFYGKGCKVNRYRERLQRILNE